MTLFDHNTTLNASPGNLNLISGAPGMGITSFMLSLLDYNTEKKEILFISTDKSVAYLKKTHNRNAS